MGPNHLYDIIIALSISVYSYEFGSRVGDVDQWPLKLVLSKTCL